MPKPTAQFPGAIATDAALAIATNRLTTRLTSAISATATSMILNPATGVVANSLLTIDSEIVRVTADPVGNVAQIERHYDGTTAASHLAGATVSGFVDAYHHNTLVAEIEAIEAALGVNLGNVASGPALITTLYNFTPQTPGGTLSPGAQSIPLAPVPLGVNGTDLFHCVRIFNGTGTPEAVLIVGGSAVAGASTGTLIVLCANSHSGAWQIGSASSGYQEAILSLPTTGGEVVGPPGAFDIYQTISLGNGTSSGESTRNNITLRGSGWGMTLGEYNSAATGATRLNWKGPAGGTLIKIHGPCSDMQITDFMADGSNSGNNAATFIDAQHSTRFKHSGLVAVAFNGDNIITEAYDASGISSYGAGPGIWENIHLQPAGNLADGFRVGKNTYNAGGFDVARNYFRDIEINAAPTNAGWGMDFRFCDASCVENLLITGYTAEHQLKFSAVTGNKNFPQSISFIKTMIDPSKITLDKYAVTGATAGATTTIEAAGHGYTLPGEYACFEGGTGFWKAMNGRYVVQSISDSSHFVINLNSTGFGALTGSVTGYYSYLGITFTDLHREDGELNTNGSIPFMPVGVPILDIYGKFHNLTNVGVGKMASEIYQIDTTTTHESEEGAWRITSLNQDNYIDIANTTDVTSRLKNARATGEFSLESVGIDVIFKVNLTSGPLTFVRAIKLTLSTVPVYANNAAAVSGGLTQGMPYRTGADPDPICIVH